MTLPQAWIVTVVLPNVQAWERHAPASVEHSELALHSWTLKEPPQGEGWHSVAAEESDVSERQQMDSPAASLEQSAADTQPSVRPEPPASVLAPSAPASELAAAPLRW
jgi:hypothetical protein